MTSLFNGQHIDSTRLRILVGVQDEGTNGIETYAEQVAIAGFYAGHDVTLLTTTPSLVEQVRKRMGDAHVEVKTLGLPALSTRQRYLERLFAHLQTRRIGAALRNTAAAHELRERQFDAVHLNRAALAPYVSGLANRVYVAGWFYPHALLPRACETWRHTRGPMLRRGVITAKSLSFFRADDRGYRAATAIVACTDVLAAQLRGQGLHAVSCPPPIRVGPFCPRESDSRFEDARHLLICGADLSHPRKNLIDAVRALATLAENNYRITLRAIGKHPETLIRAAAHLPDRVRFEALGSKSPDEVHQLMSQAHVLVLPSLYEEWGYVAIESMLSGTPVVTYPVYPFSDILSGGLGVVASEKQPKALANAIERVLLDRACLRGKDLIAAATRRYGSDAVGARLSAIWQTSNPS